MMNENSSFLTSCTSQYFVSKYTKEFQMLITCPEPVTQPIIIVHFLVIISLNEQFSLPNYSVQRR